MGIELEILNKQLFWRKLALVTVSMAVLVPLVMLKTRVPAIAYVSALLIIHVLVLVVYLYKVDWRSFSRTGLAARIAAVVILSYLLSKVKFAEGPDVLLSIVVAFGLHALILLVLMAKVVSRRAA